MEILRMPLPGTLLVSHLAAYGLAFVLNDAGVDVWVGHDADAADFPPQLMADAAIENVVRLVRASADELEDVVEADVKPVRTVNERRAVMWARATNAELAAAAQPARERLRMQADLAQSRTAAGLLAGVGVPATWQHGGAKPHRGASRLDGVLGNHTSDFVRGVLRKARAGLDKVEDDELARSWRSGVSPGVDADKTGWSPPGTMVDLAHQWLAALGLALVPVGLQANAPARTPATWRDGSTRGVTLPVFTTPVSVARLRAVLGLAALADWREASGERTAARLRGVGVREIVVFAQVDGSAKSSVAFSFARGRRVDL